MAQTEETRRNAFVSRMMSNLGGEKDAEIKRLRIALERIEYASRKDSLCDQERLASVRTIACAALSHPAVPNGERE